MGIANFYRWISNRYPCVSQVIKYYEIPEFDNLYVDINGIIYICFDAEQEDCLELDISEEGIFAKMFQYLEVIFKFVRPKNLLFLAVDGVPPFAKTNSQREGLVSSYSDQYVQEHVEPAVVSKNSITAGTKFMAQLQECFKYFINKKVSTDPAWQNVEVILSGHHVPGEGEHKIMDYIRYQKAQPGYNPNTRHCVYGLDADLILLGLATHEPHFGLLYEKVPRRKNITIPHTFHIMYLSLLREYIDADFSSLQTPFPYNLEAIIDDFVLFGCLLGNDFIPSIPGMHDKKDTFSILFKKYHEVLPTLQGYIHENGSLNMTRFERYITALAEDNFDDKTSEERLVYYNERMNVNDQDGVDHLVESFVTGVQWILHYYYTGVPSWDWFYPYHYAPFVSDIKGFSTLQPVFELGRPLLIFEHMLACFPPTLSYYLPKPYQDLMTNKDSVVIDFYPKLEGNDDLDATFLLPFIDKGRLLEAMEPFNDQLTDEEKERNTHGSCLSYRYDHQKLSGHTYPSPCPSHFLDVLNCKSSCTDLSSDPFPIKKDNMVFGLCKGVSLDLYFPQFPTFRHISHTVSDSNEDRRHTNPFPGFREYKCINIPPQLETAHLRIQSLNDSLVGKTCYVRWPYMTEAKVTSLHYYDSSRRDLAQTAVQEVVRNYWEHQAIKISELKVIVEVQELQGALCYVQQWSRSYTYYPLQAIVMHRSDDALQQHHDTLAELFRKGDTCFVLKPECDLYGKLVEVSSVDMVNERVYVKVQVEPEAAVHTKWEKLKTQYYPIGVVATRLGINRGILSKIIGSLFCEVGSPSNEHPGFRVNIGLKLLCYKKELPGYTQWRFSKLSLAAEDLIKQYKERFPSVFRYLCEQEVQNQYYESDLFPADTSSNDDDNDSGLGACLDWLDSLPTREIELVDYSCKALEQSQIEELQSTIKKIIQVEPVQLFKPTDHHGGLIPDPDASYKLLDRVVNVSKTCAVPFGLRGTVIGITKGEPDNSSVYEVLYDEMFPGGLSIRGSMKSAYYHPPSCLINLTHGTRIQQHNDDQHVPFSRRRNSSQELYQSPHHFHDEGRVRETRERRYSDREDSWRKSNYAHEVASHLPEATRNESYRRPTHGYDVHDSWQMYRDADRDSDHHDQGWHSEGEYYRNYGESGESYWRDRDQRARGRSDWRDRDQRAHERSDWRDRDQHKKDYDRDRAHDRPHYEQKHQHDRKPKENEGWKKVHRRH